MKFLNLNKVLCISPHPDDVELAMMGTIIKYEDTFFDVLCLTKGGARGFDNTNKSNRRDEVNHVWERASVNNVIIYHSEYDYFEDSTESGWINLIENRYVKVNDYDCIMIPTNEDSMFEHRFVSKFGSALCRFSDLSLIEYRTFSTLNTWIPNLFVDVTKQYMKKDVSLKLFLSQQHKTYFQKPSLDAFHSNFQCSKKGLDKIEQFKIIELFGREN